METYRKVQCSDRLPNKPDWYDTDDGKVNFTTRWMNFNRYPDWWLEELPPPQSVSEEEYYSIVPIIEQIIDRNKEVIESQGWNIFALAVAEASFDAIMKITSQQPVSEPCQYESDNTTGMNCKHCGDPKWTHEISNLSRLQLSPHSQIITEGEIEKLVEKYKKDLETFKDLLNSCNPNNLNKIRNLRYKVSCHRNMVTDLEKAITALQGKEQRGEESIAFAKWINNNWYTPQGLPDHWLLKAHPSDLLSKNEIFSTDELYRMYNEESAPPPKKQGDNEKEGEG